MRRQSIHKPICNARRMSPIRHPGLFRQRAPLEPVQEFALQPARHSQLRIMHMYIDKPRQQISPAPIPHHCIRPPRPNRRKLPARRHPAVFNQ